MDWLCLVLGVVGFGLNVSMYRQDGHWYNLLGAVLALAASINFGLKLAPKEWRE